MHLINALCFRVFPHFVGVHDQQTLVTVVAAQATEELEEYQMTEEALRWETT